MDLSALPLMPGAELPEAVPPAPEATPVPPARPYNWQPEERAVEGCPCPSCERLRDREQVRVPPPIQPAVFLRESPAESVGLFDLSQAFAAATSTGRISARSPQIANLPRSAPLVQESRRIRGRYTVDTGANGSMAGEARWLDTDTGKVYSSEYTTTHNNRLTAHGDGTWGSLAGMVWEEV